MIRFLEAGLIAGIRQVLAVILITTVFVAASENIVPESASGSVGWQESASSVPVLLTWTYLLTAIGFALTHDHRLVITAKRIRYATRVLVVSIHLERKRVS